MGDELIEGEIIEGETSYNWQLQSLNGTLTTGTTSISSVAPKKVYRKYLSISETGSYHFAFNGTRNLWIWITTSSYASAYVYNKAVPVPSSNVIASNYTETNGGFGEIIEDEIVYEDGSTPTKALSVSSLSASTYYLYFCFADYSLTSNQSLDITVTKNSSTNPGGDDVIVVIDPVESYNWSIYTGITLSGSGTRSTTLYPKRIYKSSFSISTSGTFKVSSSVTGLTLWISSSSSCYNANKSDPVPSSGVITSSYEMILELDNPSPGPTVQTNSLQANTTYYFYYCISDYNAANSISTTFTSTFPAELGPIIEDDPGNTNIDPSDNPANSDTTPTENINSPVIYYSADGYSTSYSSDPPTENNVTINDNSNLQINPTLFNSLIDAWNSICNDRHYFGNLSGISGQIQKITTNSNTHYTQINTLINTYQKYFQDSIQIVNSNTLIQKSKLNEFKNVLQDKNRSCKQACTGLCTTTTSNRSMTSSCNGQCSGGCYGHCTGCDNTCTNNCGYCTGGCSTSCIFQCQEECLNTCGDNCTGSAEGQIGAGPGQSQTSTVCDTCVGTCQAQCQTDCNNYCVHACATGCYTNYCKGLCNTNCSNSCGEYCGTACSGGNNDGYPNTPQLGVVGYYCGGSCNQICGSDCGGHCGSRNCTGGCSSGCQNYCTGICDDACENACQNFCGNGCTSSAANATGVSGCNGCSGSCSTACSNTCGDNCGGGCTDLCQLNCTGQCATGCKTDCYDGCKEQAKIANNSSNTNCNSSVCKGTGCVSYCQGGCKTGCKDSLAGSTSSCNSGCTADCATSCYTYCVTSSN